MKPETVEDVLALIETQPDDAELFQLLGQMYVRAGQFHEALAAYERSLIIAPDNPWTHLYLGNWFYHHDRHPEALAEFKRAAELMPGEAIVYTCQGDIHKAQGEFDLAEQAYKDAARVAPEAPLSRRKLTEWYEFKNGKHPS